LRAKTLSSLCVDAVHTAFQYFDFAVKEFEILFDENVIDV